MCGIPVYQYTVRAVYLVYVVLVHQNAKTNLVGHDSYFLKRPSILISDTSSVFISFWLFTFDSAQHRAVVYSTSDRVAFECPRHITIRDRCSCLSRSCEKCVHSYRYSPEEQQPAGLLHKQCTGVRLTEVNIAYASWVLVDLCCL